MRIISCLLLISGTGSGIFGQSETNLSRPVIIGKNKVLAEDTVIQKWETNPKKNQLPYNGMPNVILVKPIPPVYKGNNGKGFDIYEANPDRMPVLVPDSSFVYNMPKQKVTAEYLQELTEKLRRQKNKEPEYREAWQPVIKPKPKTITIVPNGKDTLINFLPKAY